jgi:hypothetical protein
VNLSPSYGYLIFHVGLNKYVSNLDWKVFIKILQKNNLEIIKIYIYLFNILLIEINLLINYFDLNHHTHTHTHTHTHLIYS